MKVVIATPTIKKPHDAYLKALEDCVPALDAVGFNHSTVFEIGSSYISHARAVMLRKALDAKADYVLFIDHDVSWTPESIVKLLEAPGDVVAGTYRFKQDEERYMGYFYQEDGIPCSRWPDGALEADRVPAGFLKVSKEAVDMFMTEYPELCFGPKYAMSVDLFNHGADDGDWWGEDYAFSRKWRKAGGDIWLVPDLDLTHHLDEMAYPGNLHKFMMRKRSEH